MGDHDGLNDDSHSRSIALVKRDGRRADGDAHQGGADGGIRLLAVVSGTHK